MIRKGVSHWLMRKQWTEMNSRQLTRIFGDMLGRQRRTTYSDELLAKNDNQRLVRNTYVMYLRYTHIAMDMRPLIARLLCSYLLRRPISHLQNNRKVNFFKPFFCNSLAFARTSLADRVHSTGQCNFIKLAIVSHLTQT
jgi:hypothetical protein